MFYSCWIFTLKNASPFYLAEKRKGLFRVLVLSSPTKCKTLKNIVKSLHIRILILLRIAWTPLSSFFHASWLITNTKVSWLHWHCITSTIVYCHTALSVFLSNHLKLYMRTCKYNGGICHQTFTNCLVLTKENHKWSDNVVHVFTTCGSVVIARLHGYTVYALNWYVFVWPKNCLCFTIFMFCKIQGIKVCIVTNLPAGCVL